MYYAKVSVKNHNCQASIHHEALPSELVPRRLELTLHLDNASHLPLPFLVIRPVYHPSVVDFFLKFCPSHLLVYHPPSYYRYNHVDNAPLFHI